MACFEEAAASKKIELDLMKWMETWLQTSGINTIETQSITEKDGKWEV
jgi:hypothetical protein